MRNKRLIKFILPLVVLLFSALPVSQIAAAPQLPHYFYGTVKLGGSTDAPIGTTIEARGDGIVQDASNPITITEAGKYGSANSLAEVPRLLVQGDIVEGTLITFYVDGEPANETAYFSPGGITVLNLTTSGGDTPPADTGSGDTPPATDTNPPPSNTGGTTPPTGGSTTTTPPVATPTPVTVTGLVASNELALDDLGQTVTAVTLSNNDNSFSLEIPASTTIGGTARNQMQLSATPVDIAAVVNRAPDKAVLLGYDFGPDGSEFSPGINLTLAYDPALIPQGITENDLKVAWWDVQNSQWVILNGTMDPIEHTIKVTVQHFTEFVILYDVPVNEPTTADTVPDATTTTDPAPDATTTDTEPATTTEQQSIISDDPNVVITEQDDEVVVSYNNPDQTADTLPATKNEAAQVKPATGSLLWLWIVLGGVTVVVIGLLLYRRYRIY